MKPSELAPGIIIAAPSSGSGKTVLTLGLLAAFRQQGVAVAAAKAGPDYIDPAFHARATERACVNLDCWAMRPETLEGLATGISRNAALVLCEGVMGLFDGADGGGGATADLAAATGWPVVLVIDCKGQAASAAATLRGFATHRPDVAIDGVVFNRVGGARHRRSIEDAVTAATPDVAILGFVPKNPLLALPERHLGLVQAGERGGFDAWLADVGKLLTEHLDLDRLRALARPFGRAGANAPAPIPPLGQHIAVARDEAFSFVYQHTLEGWRTQGAALSFFSPLADEAPDSKADSVYLPGGYPELHTARLAQNRHFLKGLRNAAQNCFIYGECGGFMVLGKSLTDSEGKCHRMADLLPIETSFADPAIHLGYRRAAALAETPLGPRGSRFTGHEFHYAKLVSARSNAPALFDCTGAQAGAPVPAGVVVERTAGSFIHLIDRAS